RSPWVASPLFRPVRPEIARKTHPIASKIWLAIGPDCQLLWREAVLCSGGIEMPAGVSLEILEQKERLKSLKEMLHRYSVPAAEAMIEHKPDGAVQCFAC